MDIRTQLKIIAFVKTPQKASSIAKEFGLSNATCYKKLKALEKAGIVKIKWREGKKFYQANIDFFK